MSMHGVDRCRMQGQGACLCTCGGQHRLATFVCVEIAGSLSAVPHCLHNSFLNYEYSSNTLTAVPHTAPPQLPDQLVQRAASGPSLQGAQSAPRSAFGLHWI